MGSSGLPGVGGPLSGGGYTQEIAAVSVAVQYAVPAAMPVIGGVVFAAALVGTQVAEPMLVLPFVNVIMPVGPAPLLFVTTYAVKVTLVPGVTELRLLSTATEVAALVIVTESVLLVPA